MKVSFVIPTYNEHGNIVRLIHEINQVSITQNFKYEIIIIDDNSTDGTIKDIKELQENQSNIILYISSPTSRIISWCMFKRFYTIS